MVDQTIRIFPHSREEFETDDELMSWLHNGLRLRDGEYYLRSTQGVGSISPGSIVLFRFDKDIMGEAIVKEDVKEVDITENEVRYEGMIKFEASSIRIYRRPVEIKFLESLTGRDFSVARTYFKIDNWDIYPQILAEVAKYGFF